VQAGDTLSAIAARLNTTAAAIQRLNGLSGDLLQAGQVLRVPRAGAGPEGAVGAKRIEVDVSEQRMYVWQGDTLVWNFTVSTGIAGYPTRYGTFAVQSKIPNAWSSAWQLWMPHWLGIYYAGPSENGIHSLPIINGQRLWAGNLGSPISYGCVVLGVNEAELLYNWADIGTPVEIHE
jgi:lipoprotein-anchoring transpeptidase ErfK/SrfK